MKVLYLLSDNLNYELLICDDAGPGYAYNMGWQCIYLNNFKLLNDNTIVIVDNRMQPEEVETLETLVTTNNHTAFFFKIVDPYYENKTHYYYEFLSRISCYKNAYLLSVYQAREITEELKVKFKNRFIHLPYPYIKSNEINHTSKKNKILISGALNEFIYPYRHSVWKQVTRSFSRIFFSILTHPGYAELHTKQKNIHLITKTAFIKYISQYKYLLLCPSRCGIEFFKFNECAYAGCIPVGVPPDSYPPNIKTLFLQLRATHLIKDVAGTIFNNKQKNTVAALRAFLDETRNPNVLNTTLKKFIIEHPIHTS